MLLAVDVDFPFYLEGSRIAKIDRIATIAHDEMLAIVGKPPSVSTIADFPIDRQIIRIQNEQLTCLPGKDKQFIIENSKACLLYTSPSPRDRQKSRMPSSA